MPEEQTAQALVKNRRPPDALLELPPAGADQVVADVGLARVRSLFRRLAGPLDALERHPHLRLATRLRLFFDRVTGLHDDNACAGCHAPNSGFGDSQSMAIGVQNNNLVGSRRTGPRNQRRTPSVANTAFFPSLMWNGRFSAPSGSHCPAPALGRASKFGPPSAGTGSFRSPCRTT